MGQMPRNILQGIWKGVSCSQYSCWKSHGLLSVFISLTWVRNFLSAPEGKSQFQSKETESRFCLWKGLLHCLFSIFRPKKKKKWKKGKDIMFRVTVMLSSNPRVAMTTYNMHGLGLPPEKA
jgi:hypothetical protein